MEYTGLLFADKCFMFSILYMHVIHSEYHTEFILDIIKQNKHGVKAFRMKYYSGVPKDSWFIV
jgi:hypothetical protein